MGANCGRDYQVVRKGGGGKGMKILHLLYESEGDYFGIGGVGIRAYEIYTYLKGRHDITLLCKKYPGAADGEKKGLKHVFVGTESRSLTKTLLSYACHAALFVKRHGGEYDVIIEDFSPAIPTFLHACTEKPVVLQVQGHTGALYFGKYNPLYAMTLYVLELLRPRFYDNFIFIGPETAIKMRVGREKRTQIVSNGVSHELLDAAPEEGEYILYIGRIDIYGKGLDILVKAYREVHAAYPHIRLVIAGDGRDRDAFQAELMKLPDGVRNSIELVGWVSGERKTEVLRKALFCVFPSRHEVQSICSREARACGKAVIVSDIPEFEMVRDTGAGITFRSGDAPSLAQAMKDLVLSNERKEMGKRGRESMKDLTWDKIALEYEGYLLGVSGVR
jgi:glycosyltransferase involved in cell wall biosynthesis